MEYKNAKLEGQWNLLLIGLLEKTIVKKQITNINYDQNSMSIIKKILTKSNSHQIKPKQNKFTYTSLEKILDLSSIRLGNRLKKRAHRS